MRNQTRDRDDGPQKLNVSSTELSPAEAAIKYCVDDLPGALIPFSRLSNILKQLDLGDRISGAALEFLHNKGLLALLSYARGKFTFSNFLKEAKSEQSERCLAAEARALKEQAEQKLKDEVMQARQRQIQERWAAEKRAFDNDPRNIARLLQIELRHKYDLYDFIERYHFPTLMKILRRVDNRVRLSEDEVVWLKTEGKDYCTPALRKRYHRNEADYYAGEFEKSKDHWFAVNASSHYRKCGESKTADTMLSMIHLSGLKNVKLKSAICTTHGGAKRDLGKLDDALSLGEQAHLLTPQDFRPCTLLGAVNYEIGNHELGRTWYEKAVERGFTEESVDDELRSIFMRAEKTKKIDLCNHLLALDPVRYSWAKLSGRNGRKK